MLFEFMRRTAGRNKMHLVKVESPVGGACYRQVAIVNGIEGSAKQRDAARMVMFRGSALRLRGRQYASQGALAAFSHKSSNRAGALRACVSVRSFTSAGIS